MPIPPHLAALGACAVLGGLGVLQILLAGGRPLGRFAWGGQHRVLPRHLRIGSVVSLGLYAGFAAILLDAAGLVSVLPVRVSALLIWASAAYFALGVVVNMISRSRPERLTMTPVAAILALLTLRVALG